VKAIVVLLIVGVAGFMAYRAFAGECQGGHVFTSEAQCRQSGAISTVACATVFGQADSVTGRGATVFSSEQLCLGSHDACVRSSVAQGFTPVPAGFCVKASGNSVTSQEPVYRRINAPQAGGQR
jgi:hypothetical protein